MFTKSRETGSDRGNGLYNPYSPHTSSWLRGEEQHTKEWLTWYHTSYVPETSMREYNPAFNCQETFTSTERVRPYFNDCTHVKAGHVNRAYSAFLGYSVQNYTIYSHHRELRTYPTCTPITDLNTSYLQARHRGWYHLQPRFEGEISMLNFLFELKDFRDIAKRIGKLRPDRDLEFGNKFLTALRKMRKSHDEFEPTSAAASTWLTLQYAVNPLLSDINNMMKNAKQMADEAYDTFVARGLDLQARHYSEIIYDNKELIVHHGPAGIDIGRSDIKKFTSTLSYKFGYRQLTDKQMYEKYWGLKLDPSVAYNMGPFTFLLDYFINFAGALKALELDENLLLEPFQYSESVLTDHKSGSWIAGDETLGSPYMFLLERNDSAIANDFDYDPDVGTQLNGFYTSHYVRERMPWPRRGLYIPKMSLPSGVQGLNMLALARVLLPVTNVNL